MLDTDTIRTLFKALNDELRNREVIGEVGICGDAVMCLVFNARKSTKDVDRIFEPTKDIRDAAGKVARKLGAPKDWLNDADDVRFLVAHLQLEQPKAVFTIVEKFYPKQHIPAKAQFFIEELFEA